MILFLFEIFLKIDTSFLSLHDIFLILTSFFQLSFYFIGLKTDVFLLSLNLLFFSFKNS